MNSFCDNYRQDESGPSKIVFRFGARSRLHLRSTQIGMQLCSSTKCKAAIDPPNPLVFYGKLGRFESSLPTWSSTSQEQTRSPRPEVSESRCREFVAQMWHSPSKRIFCRTVGRSSGVTRRTAHVRRVTKLMDKIVPTSEILQNLET